MRITTTDHALELLDSIRRAAQLRGDEAEAKLLEAVTAHITDRVVLRLEVERDLAALRTAAAAVYARAERRSELLPLLDGVLEWRLDTALRELRPLLGDTQNREDETA